MTLAMALQAQTMNLVPSRRNPHSWLCWRRTNIDHLGFARWNPWARNHSSEFGGRWRAGL